MRTLILSFAVLFHIADSTAPGSVKLDNYTFDKAVAIPGRNWLVKFDKSYAYGEKEDQFKILCKQAFQLENFFIADVPVQEFGDKENEDLREKFAIGKDEFPAYFLFTDADRKGIRYKGAVTAHDIAIWLRQNGVKMPAIGTIYDMDQVVTKFMREGGKSDAHIAEIKKLAEGEYKTDRKSAMYVKICEKVKEAGVGYVEKEQQRIDKIMKGKLTPEKKEELNDKLKILLVFGDTTDH